MNKRFKKIATLLITVATVTTISLQTYACENNFILKYGKDVGYNNSPTLHQEELIYEWDEKCNTYCLNKIAYDNISNRNKTVGNKLLKVKLYNKNSYDDFRNYYKTLRFVDIDDNPLCDTKYPIMAQRTGYDTVTFSVSDNAVFQYTDYLMGNGIKYPNGVSHMNFYYEISGFHILPGFEVKFVKTDDKKYVLYGETKDFAYYGDDLFDDAEDVKTKFTVYMKTIDAPKGKYNVIMNGITVHTIQIR